MKMKLIRAASAAALLASVFSGVAHADGEGLAFSPLDLSIPALKGLSEGVKHVGGDKGYQVIVVDPKFNATAQAQQLNMLFTTGRVKAAWVLSVNPGAMGEVIETARANDGVLVLNGEPKDYGFEGMVPGVTFAKIDYAAFGGASGELGAECANKNFDGKGKALVIHAKEGTAGKEAIEGAMEAKLTENAPGVEVVAHIIVEERAEGLIKVGQVLQANPDLNVVVSANDEGALGAMGAFESAGVKSNCIIASGGNDEVLKSVEAGHLYGASKLNFPADMMQTFDSVAAMLADPSAEGKQIAVPLDIIRQK